MGYRADYFKAHSPVFGKYRCCRCGKWFKKENIEIDHIIPKRWGGTDELCNLQALCRSCNRSKGARPTNGEIVKGLAQSTFSGNLGSTLGSMATRKVKDTFGIKYKRK